MYIKIYRHFYKENKLKEELKIFNSENLTFINDMIEHRIPILKQCGDFKIKYERQFEMIDNLEKECTETQKEMLSEIIQLFYETERYYFFLAYSLGVKYGEELQEL